MSVKGSGRGGYQVRGGQGGWGDWGRGRSAKGFSYYGATNKHKGLCSTLGIHVFDYGQKTSSDQIKTTWKKLVHHVGTINGYDISNELINKKRLNISKPEQTQDVLDAHQLATKRRDQSYECLAESRQFQKGVYEEQVMRGEPAILFKAKISLAIINN